MEIIDRAIQIFKTLPIKKMIVSLIALGITIFLVAMLLKYLQTGTLVVTTNDTDNSITLVDLKTNSDLISTSGEMKAKVKEGKYLIKVQGQKTTTSKFIDVMARKTSEYNINIENMVSLAPFLPQPISDIGKLGNSIIYINEFGFLSKLASDGVITILSAELVFKNVQWSDSYGIGLANDNNFYTVTDSGLSKIDIITEEVYGGDLSFSFNNDKTFYVASRAKIYKIENGVGSQIYSSEYDMVTMMKNSSYISFLESNNSEYQTKEAGSKVTVLDKNGVKVASEEIESYEYQWSPSGNILATTNDEGYSKLYNNQLRVIGEFPVSNANNITWSDEKNIVYSIDDSVWKYNTESEQSIKLTNTNLKGAVAKILKTGENSKLYLVAEESMNSDKYYTYSLNMDNQKLDENVSLLSVFLPYELNSCKVSYTNNLKPLIVMGYFVSKENCDEDFNQYINENGLKSWSSFQRYYYSVEE